jgi:hypothetical protein
VLLFCGVVMAWGGVTVFLPPPLGLNTFQRDDTTAPRTTSSERASSSSSSSECSGEEFDAVTAIGVCICPRETVCVKVLSSLVFVMLSRLSAYFDYPMYVLLFISKAHNLRGVLSRG